MDHNYRGRVSTPNMKDLEDQYYYGRRPTGVYVPRFRNLNEMKEVNFIRGYAFACGSSRKQGVIKEGEQIGKDFKDNLTEPGAWQMNMTGMGECLPYAANKVTLNKDKKDKWGMPLLDIDCMFRANETTMLKDILNTGSEMLDKAGFKNIQQADSEQAPGLGIHEMGTARMGHDAKTSVLNSHNQVWGAKNVFVTDGSCMTSGACQNPSLTYMALTARAADYAVNELKKGNI